MTVAHSALTGSDLHEPKGVSTATAGKTYVSDGAGSGTWTLLPTLASQSDMETATSTTTYISPGRSHFHPGVAKCWGQVSSSGSLVTSYKISSTSRSSTGVYVINFTTAFSSANYCPIISLDGISGEGYYNTHTIVRSASSMTVGVASFSSGAFDGGFFFCVFGDV